MHIILVILLLSPFIVRAQEPGPLFKNDTLYTTCGYKIYKGKTLQIATGTGKKGKFRFISIKNGINPRSINNNTILVREIKNYRLNEPGSGRIEIVGTLVFKDGSAGSVEMDMAFDRAIEDAPDLPGELVAGAACKNNPEVKLVNELNRLFTAYTKGTIDRSTYEASKKKLLEQYQGEAPH